MSCVVALPPAQVPSEAVEQLRGILWGNLLDIVLGILLLAVGLTATVLYVLRWKSRDATLVSFGLFAGLYGMGLLAGALWLLYELFTK